MSNSEDEKQYGIMEGQMCWFPTTDDDDTDRYSRMLPNLIKELKLKEVAQD